MRELWLGLCNNKIFLTACSGWLIAQLLKVILHVLVNREWSWERLFGAGGMPSSHAAAVCALLTAIIYEYGTGSVAFAITAVLTVIVLHDARGVRLETGKQAQVLNTIINSLHDLDFRALQEIKLKELVGHTPSQVAIGAIIGVGIALILY
ncbi:MAG: divergent PAP2 family protein [Clostridiales bacterium]